MILQQILQFLQCGYRQTDGHVDRHTDRIMDRQTKLWANRPMNVWTCNICAQTCKKQSFSNRFCNFYKSITERRTDRRTDPHIEMRQPHLKRYGGLKPATDFSSTAKDICIYSYFTLSYIFFYSMHISCKHNQVLISKNQSTLLSTPQL